MDRSIKQYGFLVASAWILAGILAAGGCTDPKYKAKRAVRDGRLEEYLEEFSQMEADRPERIDALKALHAELEAKHARQMERTLKRIEESYLEDKQDWMIGAPSRKEKVHSILSGQPEKTPDVWGEMVY
jgi:hypothetical protein